MQPTETDGDRDGANKALVKHQGGRVKKWKWQQRRSKYFCQVCGSSLSLETGLSQNLLHLSHWGRQERIGHESLSLKKKKMAQKMTVTTHKGMGRTGRRHLTKTQRMSSPRSSHGFTCCEEPSLAESDVFGVEVLHLPQALQKAPPLPAPWYLLKTCWGKEKWPHASAT